MAQERQHLQTPNLSYRQIPLRNESEQRRSSQRNSEAQSSRNVLQEELQVNPIEPEEQNSRSQDRLITDRDQDAKGP